MTMFKSNIRECYYLKISHSDTLFLINKYPFEEGQFYTILNKKVKEDLHKILDTINFKSQKTILTSDTEDGETYALALKSNFESFYINLPYQHDFKHLLKFAQHLDTIKKQSNFQTYKGKIHFDEMKNILAAPPPPKISDDR